MSEMLAACLQVQNLDKVLGKHAAFKSLNLTLRQGKRVALLGLNGAGKSSFIRLLVGESKPNAGKIIYHSNSSENRQSLYPFDLNFNKNLGYQSDTMLSIADMSSREYLILCGQLKGLSSSKLNNKIDVIAKQWKIENLLERQMESLSKGNLQKLAIAQVFISDPKFLFFDEPCQSLDPLEQDRFNQNIKNLMQFDLCVFSTHNVAHALEVADEIVLFHQSQIAYHFDLKTQQSHQPKNYLAVCKAPESKLDNSIRCSASQSSLDLGKQNQGRQDQEQSNWRVLAKQLNLTINQLNPRVYQICDAQIRQIEQLILSLQQANQTPEFCLPEEQAVMPLFRLLASGEIELNQTDHFYDADIFSVDLKVDVEAGDLL